MQFSSAVGRDRGGMLGAPETWKGSAMAKAKRSGGSEGRGRKGAAGRSKRAPGRRATTAGGARAPAEPRFRAFLAVSLDSYIADQQSGVGWLDPYFTPEIDFEAFWRTIGATVMGRATWSGRWPTGTRSRPKAGASFRPTAH